MAKLEDLIKMTIGITHSDKQYQYFLKRKCYPDTQYLKIAPLGNLNAHLIWCTMQENGEMKEELCPNNSPFPFADSIIPISAQEILATDWEIYTYTDMAQMLEITKTLEMCVTEKDFNSRGFMTKIKTIDDNILEAQNG